MTAEIHVSPTLAAIEPRHRPERGTVCEGCPSSMWFQLANNEVKCYCKAMYIIVWSGSERNELILCDGEARTTEAG